MYKNSNKLFNNYFLINFLLALIPISYVIGNLILNLNILIFILFSFFICRKEISEFKINLFDKFILIYFSYILLIGVYNFITASTNNFEIIIKSFLYLRFLLLYFVLRLLMNKKIINFQFFFVVSSFLVLFVSLDVIYQYNFGKDIFGFEGNGRRLGGPFGDELIAGGFLQKFSFFLFFLLATSPFFKKFSSRKLLVLFLFSSAIIIFGFLFAGNRVSFMMFFLTSILIFIFFKNKRIYFLSIIISVISIFYIMYNSNLEIAKHYGHAYIKAKDIVTPFSEKNLINNDKFEKLDKSSDQTNYSIKFKNKNYLMNNAHILQFYSGYLTWSEKKMFGGGVKTYRYNCPKVMINCTTHPHNYYLEILTDLGIVGLLIISFIFVYLIYISIFNKAVMASPFFYIFISEIFPFKSTGSFFTTSNSTFIFLILSILASLSLKKN